MTIGEIIGSGRARSGLTLSTLATRVLKENGTPISVSYLNDVEHDRRPPPSPHLLRQIAQALHLSYEYLLFIAGDLPDDLRVGNPTPEAVEAGWAAFRTTLREHEGRQEEQLSAAR